MRYVMCYVTARTAVRDRRDQDHLQHNARHVSPRVHVCCNRRSAVQGSDILCSEILTFYLIGKIPLHRFCNTYCVYHRMLMLRKTVVKIAINLDSVLKFLGESRNRRTGLL